MNIRAKIFGGTTPGDPLVRAKSPKGARADALRSVSVPREESRRADTRHKDRHRVVDEAAQVAHKGTIHNVQLINVSGGGAMVSRDFEPVPWDRVDVHLGDHGRVECAVLWVKDGRIGLEFAHETRLDCPEDQQAALLREVISRNFKDAQFEAPVERTPEPAPEEHRSEWRHPLIWSGVLHFDYQSTPTRLRNISSTGAMIETSVELVPGVEPLLDLGQAGSIFASVIWTVGDQAGLRFKEPFDLAQLAKLRPKVAPAKWERPAYLDPGASSDSPWEKHWKRLSLNELSQELDGFPKH